MKEIKNRWQFILGFAAIIISLSAFKDELEEKIVDFNFISFSLAEYLFWLIISFVSVIHLYAVPYILSSTKYSNRKVFKYIESSSYTLFLMIILSPTIIFVLYLLQLLLLQIFGLDVKMQYYLMVILIYIICLLAVWLSAKTVKKYRIRKKEKEQSELLSKEVKSFEMIDKLIEDGYYNQSLFEAFKAIEMSLYKVLRQKDIVFRRGNFLEMINMAKKYNVFSNKQIEQINEVRIKRNEFAHNIESKITEEEARNAKRLLKEIMAQADSDITELDKESESKYFMGKVFNDLEQAKKASKKKQKPMFIVIYDESHPKKSKLSHSLGYFMEYKTTKKLVQKNFIQVLISSENITDKHLIPIDEPLENCLLVILSPDNNIVRQEGVYANSDEGLKRVREIIATWNRTDS